MSEYNLIWRRYGLSGNPYQTNPITMSGRSLGTEAFVGRESEREELWKSLRMGRSQRIVVYGEPGVGKTSLVNFVRKKAKENGYFTPTNEIEVEEEMSKEDFILLTLSAIFREVESNDLELSEGLKDDLEKVYDATQKMELQDSSGEEWRITAPKLKSLTRELLGEIREGGFEGVIVHYDNLDNIEDVKGISSLMSNVRDFLQTEGMISIFIGDEKVPMALRKERRVGQIFQDPIEIETFDLSDIVEVLSRRIELLQDENSETVTPHTRESVEELFDLHEGNIRDILNSLQTAIRELPDTNTPVRLKRSRMEEELYSRIHRTLLDKLSDTDREYLEKVLEKGPIYPSKLAELLDKRRGAGSVYIERLKGKDAVRKAKIKEKEDGKKKFFEVTPRVRWVNLKDEEDEISQDPNSKLGDFTQ